MITDIATCDQRFRCDRPRLGPYIELDTSFGVADMRDADRQGTWRTTGCAGVPGTSRRAEWEGRRCATTLVPERRIRAGGRRLWRARGGVAGIRVILARRGHPRTRPLSW